MARIALAHDWLVGYRGGEAVLESIARVVASRHLLTRIYTMFDDGRALAPTIDRTAHTVATLGRLPLASTRLRRWMLPAYPALVADLSRRLAEDHAGVGGSGGAIDLLISTSSAAVKGLRAPDGVPHLCYCHTPARYLWSQQEEYGRGGGIGAAARALGLRLFGAGLREWDRRTSANVTRFIANSNHTAAQIRSCFDRDASVIHPPVRTEFFTPGPDQGGRDPDRWLYVGALEPYKRADLAIAAATHAGASLTVIGSGTQSARLRAAADANVRFLGRVEDEQLREEYRRASVLLFPQVEDFGIVAVEAQACGTPVAAFRAGGALDSVVDGATGVFFDMPTPVELSAAARRAAGLPAPARACRENAERFSEANFERSIAREIEAELRRA